MTNMLIEDKKQRNLRKTPLLLNFQFFLVSKDTWWLSLDLILFFHVILQVLILSDQKMSTVVSVV